MNHALTKLDQDRQKLFPQWEDDFMREKPRRAAYPRTVPPNLRKLYDELIQEREAVITIWGEHAT